MTPIRHDVNYMSDIDALMTEWYCWLNNAVHVRSGDTISNRRPALGHCGRINPRPPSAQRARAITDDYPPPAFFFFFSFFFFPLSKVCSRSVYFFLHAFAATKDQNTKYSRLCCVVRQICL